jgi:hypothetical protein
MSLEIVKRSLEIVRSRGVLSIAVRILERVGTTVVVDLKSDRRSGSTNGRQLIRKLNPRVRKPERCGPGDSSVGWLALRVPMVERLSFVKGSSSLRDLAFVVRIL